MDKDINNEKMEYMASIGKKSLVISLRRTGKHGIILGLYRREIMGKASEYYLVTSSSFRKFMRAEAKLRSNPRPWFHPARLDDHQVTRFML